MAETVERFPRAVADSAVRFDEKFCRGRQSWTSWLLWPYGDPAGERPGSRLLHHPNDTERYSHACAPSGRVISRLIGDASSQIALRDVNLRADAPRSHAAVRRSCHTLSVVGRESYPLSGPWGPYPMTPGLRSPALVCGATSLAIAGRSPDRRKAPPKTVTSLPHVV